MKFKLINYNYYICTELDTYYYIIDDDFDRNDFYDLINFDHFNIRYNEI